VQIRTHRDLDIWKEGIELEGAARNSSKEFMQFLYIALGSAAELETQLIISKKLGFMTNEDLFERLERVKSKILGLIRYLKGKRNGR
jgi:four helix bundle protein